MSQEKKILIVEDERTLMKIAQKKFEHDGFEVITAGDGEIGLKTALEQKPDLILLDIVMPNMDGLTMLKKLRKDEWGKDVPVIILTNLSEADKSSDNSKELATDFLVKSDWKLSDVVEKVRKVLG